MKKYLSLAIVSIALVLFLRVSVDKTAPVFFEIVKQMGYDDVSEKPYEVVEFTIPQNFNAVYERYNDMQKKNGYNLENYKGKKCKRYTYLIPSQNARANIIVCDGKIIGGDIMSITLDGIMIPIEKNAKTH